MKKIKEKRKMKINNLRNGYSKYVFKFLKNNAEKINNKMCVGDIGAGHFRNLKYSK